MNIASVKGVSHLSNSRK